MKFWLTLFLLFIFSFSLSGQTTRGKVTNQKHQGISNVNIFIAGSYDGSSSDSTGQFKFSTTTTGKQRLVLSRVGYTKQELEIEIRDRLYFDFVMVSESNSIEAMTVRADQISVSNQS